MLTKALALGTLFSSLGFPLPDHHGITQRQSGGLQVPIPCRTSCAATLIIYNACSNNDTTTCLSICQPTNFASFAECLQCIVNNTPDITPTGVSQIQSDLDVIADVCNSHNATVTPTPLSYPSNASVSSSSTSVSSIPSTTYPASTIPSGSSSGISTSATATPSHSTPAPIPPSPTSLNPGAIAGIAIGSILGVLAVAFAMYFVIWRRKKGGRRNEYTSGGLFDMGRDDVPPPVEPFMSQAYEGGWASHDGRRGSSSLNGSPSTAFTTPPNDRRISLASIDNLTVGAAGSGQSPSPPLKGVVAVHPYAQLAPSPVQASNLPLAVPSSSSQTGSMSEEPCDTTRPPATSFLRHVDGGPAPLPSDAEQQMELPPLYGDVPTSQGRA